MGMERQNDSNSKRRFTTRQLRDAGASEEFISLYLSAVDSRAKTALNDGRLGRKLAEGKDITNISGSWFRNIWNGNLFWSLLRADSRNATALAEVFSREHFVEDGLAEGEPRDYVERMVDQNLAQAEA